MSVVKRYVIFGGSGFIGSRVCLYLKKAGHHVVCLGRKNVFSLQDGIEFHAIDFMNPSTWLSYIEEGDFICDLVAPAITKDFGDKEEKQYFKSVATLAEVSLEKKIRLFLYVSSGGSVYGPYDKCFKEHDERRPISPYGILKRKTEDLLMDLEKKGLPLCVARPSNIYGEAINEIKSVGVITNFYERISQHRPIDIFGNLEISKDYLHVEDLARAFGLIFEKEKRGIFNLGQGEVTSLAEIIKKIERVTGEKALVNYMPVKDTDILRYALDCNKARLELEFIPAIGLDEGIERYKKGQK